RRHFASAILAGLAGLLLNAFTLDVFGGAKMSFGGIFSLAAALHLGPVYGVLASVFVEAGASIRNHHAPHFGIYGLEAFIVGWCARRRILPMIADSAYWSAFGILLAVGGGHLTLPAPALGIAIK